MSNNDIFDNVEKKMNYSNYPDNFDKANVIDDNAVSRHDFVIKPTDKAKVSSATQIPLQLIVDSRDRDTSTHSNSNNYSVSLPEVYENITSIELIGAEIPKTEYLINDYNNKIEYHNGSGNTSITITNGDYNITDLISTINTAFDNNSSANITLSVASTATQKIQIANTTGSTNIFYWKADTEEVSVNGTTRPAYRTNTIAKILGFNKSDVTIANSGTATAPNRYDLSGTKFIMLNIRDLDVLNGTYPGIDGAFARIILDNDSGTVKYLKASDIGKGRFIKYFNPPLGKLQKLDISFVTYDNNPYDFNGHDHTLFLQMMSLNQSSKYFV